VKKKTVEKHGQKEKDKKEKTRRFFCKNILAENISRQ
jgi:hypothetical protein